MQLYHETEALSAGLNKASEHTQLGRAVAQSFKMTLSMHGEDPREVLTFNFLGTNLITEYIDNMDPSRDFTLFTEAFNLDTLKEIDLETESVRDLIIKITETVNKGTDFVFNFNPNIARDQIQALANQDLFSGLNGMLTDLLNYSDKLSKVNHTTYWNSIRGWLVTSGYDKVTTPPQVNKLKQIGLEYSVPITIFYEGLTALKNSLVKNNLLDKMTTTGRTIK